MASLTHPTPQIEQEIYYRLYHTYNFYPLYKPQKQEKSLDARLNISSPNRTKHKSKPYQSKGEHCLNLT